MLRRLASSTSRAFSATRAFSSSSSSSAAAAAATRPTSITVNNRTYNLPKPAQQVVGICIDGCAVEYLDAAMQAGVMPHLASGLGLSEWSTVAGRGSGRKPESVGPESDLEKGDVEGAYQFLNKQGLWSRGLVAGVVPSFTNPNNVSIVTGATPSVHGIVGNTVWNRETGEEEMMNGVAWLDAETILAKVAETNEDDELMDAMKTTVVAVTSKDKLRALLSNGLSMTRQGSFGFSAENMNKDYDAVASQLAVAGFNVDEMMTNCAFLANSPPSIYDPVLSPFTLAMGAELVAQNRARGNAGLFYLSTTDYVQHKHAPGDPEANLFYSQVDQVLKRLDEEGAVVAFTADHGMNDKYGFDGQPNVVFAEAELHKAGITSAHVTLPITDPYVAHHGALGSYATVYFENPDLGSEEVHSAFTLLRSLPGIHTVMPRDEAAAAFDLRADRIGELVVLADRHTVIGKSPDFHDLESVPKLRSHGGLAEATVPLIVNRQLTPEYTKKLMGGTGRNYDLFDFLLNGVAE